jgi:hypothetical protein
MICFDVLQTVSNFRRVSLSFLQQYDNVPLGQGFQYKGKSKGEPCLKKALSRIPTSSRVELQNTVGMPQRPQNALLKIFRHIPSW